MQIIHDAHWQGTMTFDAQHFNTTYQRKRFITSRSMHPQQPRHHSFNPFCETNGETQNQQNHQGCNWHYQFVLDSCGDTLML